MKQWTTDGSLRCSCSGVMLVIEEGNHMECYYCEKCGDACGIEVVYSSKLQKYIPIE